MKIPKTTPEKPYIQFLFNQKGNIQLSISSNWWGGKNASFSSRKGNGNTCLPKDLEKYIKAFKTREIKTIEKEILLLQKKLDKIKIIYG